MELIWRRLGQIFVTFSENLNFRNEFYIPQLKKTVKLHVDYVQTSKCLFLLRKLTWTLDLRDIYRKIYSAQFYIQLLYRPHFGTWILPFGLLGSKRKISYTTEFLLKYATFWAKKKGKFFLGQKPPQKVAYLSRNSVFSEIFHLLPNSPNGRIHVPKCGLKSNCI